MKKKYEESKENLLNSVSKNQIAITPWFKLVIENRINKIWNIAENIKDLRDNNNNKDYYESFDKIKIINYL